MWEAINRISTHYNRMRLLSEMRSGFDTAIAQHKKIIQMIDNKEADNVEKIVYQHILEPIEHKKDLLSSKEHLYLQYFKIKKKRTVFQ